MAGSRAMLYGMGISAAALIGILPLFIRSYMWVIIPLCAYAMSFGLNIATKYAACEKMDFIGASKMAIFPTLSALLAVGLLTVLPGMKGPIYSLLVNLDYDIRNRIGDAFYLFWFVLYGQLVSGGLLQVCSTA
jgi:hypothetical protein